MLVRAHYAQVLLLLAAVAYRLFLSLRGLGVVGFLSILTIIMVAGVARFFLEREPERKIIGLLFIVPCLPELLKAQMLLDL